MKLCPTNQLFNTAVAVCLTALLGVLVVSDVQAKEDLPEVSSDGLHLVKDSKARVVYAKPGASLAKYNKLIILDCYVDFKEGWKRHYNLNEVGLSGRVQDKDMEKIKKNVAAEFHRIFVKELQDKGGYEVVESEGPDVLLLRPAILNLDPTAPEVNMASFSRTIVRSAGSMTLYMELYDSATSELLVRAIDPRQDTRGGMADRASNKAAVDRILRDWAGLLRKSLDDVKT